MDSSVARTNRARRNRAEISGRSIAVGFARQWAHFAGRRAWPGENAHRENNGSLHSDRLSTAAIHPRPFARGFDRHAHLRI